MKEQGPRFNQNELTNQPNPNRLEKEGSAMAEPGNNEVNTQPQTNQSDRQGPLQTPLSNMEGGEQVQAAADQKPPEEEIELTKDQEKYFDGLRQRVMAHESWPDEEKKTQEYKNEELALTTEFNKFLDTQPVPEAYYIPTSVLELASHFKETRERLINRVIFKAYEDKTETNDYHSSMNLPALSNLDTLLGFLSKIDPEKYQRYISLKTTAEHFHRMNATLNTGNLGNFMQTAENITYQHFVLMQSIRGVPEVQRLYEQTYNEYLAKHKRITTSGYAQLKKDVEKAFLQLNEAGLVKSEFADQREGEKASRMSDWEIQRALNVGRVFYNISFRAAERIASGQVPREGDLGEKRYASFPMEQAAKLMNWVQWGGWRFDIAAVRGGVKFLEGMKERYQELLVLKGKKLDPNKIGADGRRLLEFGGMNTDEYEVGAMFGVSGLYSSWRMETMIFSQIKLGKDGQTLREWFDEQEQLDIEWRADGKKDGSPIKSIAKISHLAEEAAKQLDTKSIAYKRELDRLQTELFDIFKPVIDNIDLGIGGLLKYYKLGDAVGFKVREALWNKVAKNNLPVMINYLSKIGFGTDTDVKKSKDYKRPIATQDRIKQLLDKDTECNWNKLVKEKLKNGMVLEGTRWDILRQKLLLQQEYKVKAASGADMGQVWDIEFNADEEALIGKIVSEGQKIAPHLANVVFPYAPFLNDMPFEQIDFAGPGEEFYRRRTGGDLGSYYKAEDAFVKIMNNPGGLEYKEVLQHFDEIVKGIESPQGSKDAQQRLFPMYNEWLKLVMTTPGKRQAILKDVLQTLRKPTSLAQTEDFAGIKGLSLDEAQCIEVINQSVKLGIISSELAQDLRKKENLEVANLIWMLFRDLFWLPFFIAAQQTGKEIVKMAA